MHYLTAFPHRGGILMFPDQQSFKFFSFKVNFDFFFFNSQCNTGPCLNESNKKCCNKTGSENMN